MVSERTLSRRKKLQLLKGTLNNAVELICLQYQERDTIHLSEFRKLFTKSKELLEMAKPSWKNNTKENGNE